MRTRFLCAVATLGCIAWMVGNAVAGDAPASGGSSDPGRYSLFNPVPDDQLRDFNPDRPSRFTGPTTLDAGHFQLEMDLVNYVRDRHTDDGVGIDQWNAAPFDLRVGLTSRTELDFLYDGYLNLRSRDHVARTDHTQSGFGDLTLLFKYNLFGNAGGTFAFGILPTVKIPSATARLGNGHVEGGVDLPLNVNLPAGFQFGLELDLDAYRNDANTRYEFSTATAVYLGYSFLDKKLTVYGEWFNRVYQGPDSATEGAIDAGLVYYVGKNAEVDFGCNFGVTRAAPDYQPFVGLSVRY